MSALSLFRQSYTHVTVSSYSERPVFVVYAHLSHPLCITDSQVVYSFHGSRHWVILCSVYYWANVVDGDPALNQT